MTAAEGFGLTAGEGLCRAHPDDCPNGPAPHAYYNPATFEGRPPCCRQPAEGPDVVDETHSQSMNDLASFFDPPSPQADMLQQLMDVIDEYGIFGGTGAVTDGLPAYVTVENPPCGTFTVACWDTAYGWDPADLHTLIRTAGELWITYTVSELDRNDVLSARQKEVLAKAGALFDADEDEDDEPDARPGPGQSADNYVYVLRCGHEIDVPEPIEPSPWIRASGDCSVHGRQLVSFAADSNGRPLFPDDLVRLLDSGDSGPRLIADFTRTPGGWAVRLLPTTLLPPVVADCDRVAKVL